MKIGYGNYGMPRTPWFEMIQQVAAIGYTAIELCVGANYPTAPENLAAAHRRELRSTLGTLGIALGPLMISGVNVIEPDLVRQQANLERLRQIVKLGHDLGLERPVIVNTLGGKIAEWDERRDLLAECVRDWAQVATVEGGNFAFEPHVGGIVNSPDRALWLIDRVHNPNLKLNFDYSHFELIDVPLETALAGLIPYAAGTHVKDVRGRPPNFQFLLPGEGTLDYAGYLSRLGRAGYVGHVTVEISGQVFNAPGYDPVAAARFSYATLDRAFVAADIARR